MVERLSLKEKIKVMEHFDNGGDVEIYKTGRWTIVVEPIWDWKNFDYRIKKQKVTIEKWLGRSGKGDYIILEASNVNLYKGYELVKLLESYEVEL